MSATRYPAGNGSVGSTTTSAYRVIHADPAIVGSTAGKPPTVVVAASRPVKMDPTTDSWTKSSPTRNSPRSCRSAMIAHVPDPHGDRSSMPL